MKKQKGLKLARAKGLRGGGVASKSNFNTDISVQFDVTCYG